MGDFIYSRRVLYVALLEHQLTHAALARLALLSYFLHSPSVVFNVTWLLEPKSSDATVR